MFTDESYDSGGSIWHNTYAYQYYFYVREGVTITNLTIKPMLTDDTTATYEDWVSAEYQNYIWEELYKENLGASEKHYKIDDCYSEILVEIGYHNYGQVYGGQNVVIARNSNHPMFIPIYTDYISTPWAVVYVFWHRNDLTINSKADVNIEIKAR